MDYKDAYAFGVVPHAVKGGRKYMCCYDLHRLENYCNQEEQFSQECVDTMTWFFVVPSFSQASIIHTISSE